jgi:hypothetical protein
MGVAICPAFGVGDLRAIAHNESHVCDVALSPTRAKGHVAERRAAAPRSPSRPAGAAMHIRAVMCSCAMLLGTLFQLPQVVMYGEQIHFTQSQILFGKHVLVEFCRFTFGYRKRVPLTALTCLCKINYLSYMI